MLFRRRRRSPRARLLELIVALRYTISKIGLQVARLNATYRRTGDKSVLGLMKRLLVLQATLEVLAVKLETLVNIGVVTSETLSVVKSVVAELKGKFSDIAPSISSMLADMENEVVAIASMAGTEIPTAVGQQELNDEAYKILKEAEIIAQHRLQEIAGNEV